MIQAKCIQKFRDQNNNIYGYRLVDINGQTQDVQSKNLKQAIANNEIHVVNLKLTQDDRLVDTAEKQIQNKKILGEAPIIKRSEPGKTELFMVQVASTIFKSLGFNGEAHAIHALDNIYDDMIDKRYEIPGKHIYFNGKECILAITYFGREAGETGEPAVWPPFWIAVEAIETSDTLYEICAKSMCKCDIKSTVDKFVKEIKASISM